MTNAFDTRAATWDDDSRRQQLATDIFAALQRHIPLQTGWAALDYGCGTGLLTLVLAPRILHVTAVDSSPGMLEVLARKVSASGIENVDLLQADFAADSPPSGPFDLIVSAMTLHHVANPPALLATFRTLLRSGGVLALADLDNEDGSFHTEPAGVHHAGFDRDILSRHLSAAGFQDILFTTAARIEKNGRIYPVFFAAARNS